MTTFVCPQSRDKVDSLTAGLRTSKLKYQTTGVDLHFAAVILTCASVVLLQRQRATTHGAESGHERSCSDRVERILEFMEPTRTLPYSLDF